MELLFGYAAGLLTLINPCVLPVLPIVLASALQVSRWGPVALAAGMSLSFVTLGLGVTAFGRALGLDEQMVAQAGAVLMVGFGLMLLVPRFGTVFASATAGVSAGADARIDGLDRQNLGGQFLGGALLGAVWSPCIGPTLGGAISLASQGESLAWAGAIMVAFALGVSSIIWRARRLAATPGTDAPDCREGPTDPGRGFHRRRADDPVSPASCHRGLGIGCPALLADRFFSVPLRGV